MKIQRLGFVSMMTGGLYNAERLGTVQLDYFSAYVESSMDVIIGS